MGILIFPVALPVGRRNGYPISYQCVPSGSAVRQAEWVSCLFPVALPEAGGMGILELSYQSLICTEEGPSNRGPGI